MSTAANISTWRWASGSISSAITRRFWSGRSKSRWLWDFTSARLRAGRRGRRARLRAHRFRSRPVLQLRHRSGHDGDPPGSRRHWPRQDSAFRNCEPRALRRHAGDSGRRGGQRTGGADGASVTGPDLTDDTLLLPYDQPQAFDIIRRHAGAIAAILVEPVQNRRPDVHPGEFLRTLRELTEQLGILLIFDEVLVGFRVAPGGAQAWFGVAADMATYAKVLGAGLLSNRRRRGPRVRDGPRGRRPRRVDGCARDRDDVYGRNVCEESTVTRGGPRGATSAARRRSGSSTASESAHEPARCRPERVLRSRRRAAVDGELRIVFRFAAAGNLSFVYQPIEANLFFYHLILRGVYILGGADVLSLHGAHRWRRRSHRRSGARCGPRHEAGGFWPEAVREPVSPPAIRASVHAGEPSVSLSFFGDYAAESSPDKYNLLFAAAQFADEHGLEAVWLPERHFHSFGGFSPNPAVLASALARETRQIDIRGGSVVLPSTIRFESRGGVGARRQPVARPRGRSSRRAGTRTTSSSRPAPSNGAPM